MYFRGVATPTHQPRNQVRDDIMRHRGPLDTRAWVLRNNLLEALEMVAEEVETEYRKDSDHIQKLMWAIGNMIASQSSIIKIEYHRVLGLDSAGLSSLINHQGNFRMAALLGIVKEVAEFTLDNAVAGLSSKLILLDLAWCVYSPGCPTLENYKDLRDRYAWWEEGQACMP